MNVEGLAKRIQILEDIESIKNLKALYAEVCDDHYNPQRMVGLFTEDAVWDGGKRFGVHRGKDALIEFFTGVSDNIVFARHYFVQPRLKVDGSDLCSGTWYMWMVGTFAGNKPLWRSRRMNTPCGKPRRVSQRQRTRQGTGICP